MLRILEGVLVLAAFLAAVWSFVGVSNGAAVDALRNAPEPPPMLPGRAPGGPGEYTPRLGRRHQPRPAKLGNA